MCRTSSFPGNWSSFSYAFKNASCITFFGVFAVLRNVLRDPEDLPVVLADQRIVRRNIPAAYALYQRHVGMLLVLSCNWLDGCHGSKFRKFVQRTVPLQCNGRRGGEPNGFRLPKRHMNGLFLGRDFGWPCQPLRAVA